MDWLEGTGDPQQFEQFLLMNHHAERLYNIDIETEIPLLYAYIRNLSSRATIEEFKQTYDV